MYSICWFVLKMETISQLRNKIFWVNSFNSVEIIIYHRRWSYISCNFLCEFRVFGNLVKFVYSAFAVCCVMISFSPLKMYLFISVVMPITKDRVLFSKQTSTKRRHYFSLSVVFVIRAIPHIPFHFTSHSTNFYHFSKLCSCFVNFASLKCFALRKIHRTNWLTFGIYIWSFYKCVATFAPAIHFSSISFFILKFFSLLILCPSTVHRPTWYRYNQ